MPCRPRARAENSWAASARRSLYARRSRTHRPCPCARAGPARRARLGARTDRPPAPTRHRSDRCSCRCGCRFAGARRGSPPQRGAASSRGALAGLVRCGLSLSMPVCRSALRTVTVQAATPVRRCNSRVTSSSDERDCSPVIARRTSMCCACSAGLPPRSAACDLAHRSSPRVPRMATRIEQSVYFGYTLSRTKNLILLCTWDGRDHVAALYDQPMRYPPEYRLAVDWVGCLLPQALRRRRLASDQRRKIGGRTCLSS